MDVYEYYGKLNEGDVTEEDLAELEAVACPSGGSCGGQFTANTMACVSEAIGLALPHSAGAPAVYESRDEFAVASGNCVMDLLESNIRPRDIVTRKAMENAATVVAATGRLDQRGAALPAIAQRGGIDFDPGGGGRGVQAHPPTSPISSRAAATWPRTCSRSAACPSCSRPCSRAATCTAIV